METQRCRQIHECFKLACFQTSTTSAQVHYLGRGSRRTWTTRHAIILGNAELVATMVGSPRTRAFDHACTPVVWMGCWSRWEDEKYLHYKLRYLAARQKTTHKQMAWWMKERCLLAELVKGWRSRCQGCEAMCVRQRSKRRVTLSGWNTSRVFHVLHGCLRC